MSTRQAPGGRLVLMGSGETSPTMVELHKALVRDRGPVTVLDTPYGFQENADELTEKAEQYFRESVGADTEVATLRTADAAAAHVGKALHTVRASRYVFSGPGSPTYALRQWRAVGMGEALGQVVSDGGVVVLASAAAVTAGRVSLPVYEVYKVGLSPYWEEGLDLLAQLGLRATVVPHFNNAEGGTHDTSCCWVGRRRLAALRQEVPDLPVIGIDEHTALVIDPETCEGTVHGQGGLHLLVGDETRDVPTGGSVRLDEALQGGSVRSAAAQAPVQVELEEALARQDPAAVVAALADGQEVARAGLVAALEPVLRRGWARPDVALLVEARQRARDGKQWDIADLLRDGLAALGVTVEDTPDGQRVRDLKN
jgi:cyanophycinase-like exopeptidase